MTLTLAICTALAILALPPIIWATKRSRIKVIDDRHELAALTYVWHQDFKMPADQPLPTIEVIEADWFMHEGRKVYGMTLNPYLCRIARKKGQKLHMTAVCDELFHAKRMRSGLDADAAHESADYAQRWMADKHLAEMLGK